MTVDQKAQVANAREEQQMSNENDEQNRAEVAPPSGLRKAFEADATAPGSYAFGNAVAKVVAEHTGLKADRIVELHITADSIWVVYGVRTGRDLEDIVTRTRRIDPETGDMISDRDGRF